MPSLSPPFSSTSPTPITDARRAAADALADIRGGKLLDYAFERAAASLDPRDRRWAQELVYGMLRQRGPIDVWLGARARGGLAKLDDDVADLLRLGAYQLLSMGSVPTYAAIAQTVEQVKQRHGIGASKLANAVLRRLDRERATLGEELRSLTGDAADVLASQYSHPRWLVARWVARWGEAETRTLLECNNREAPVVLRPFGVSAPDLHEMLRAADISAKPAALVPDSVELQGGVALAQLDAYRHGAFFVQDPAATLVTRYAATPPNALVFDVCAAPGGKALELANAGARVVAVDRSEHRMKRVLDNVMRLRAGAVLPLVADALELPLRSADVVLIDAPCTGTGTFRRHPDARWRLRVSDVAVSASAQRQLLRAAAAAVRPGGLLIYSTCSLETEENDEQVEQFLRHERDFTLEPPPPGALPNDVLDAGLLRVLPQRHGVDGAFAARLRRSHPPR